MALNEKQKRFALEYLIDRNATQAAIRAGYSAKTAHAQGHKLLKKAEIKEFISKKNAKASEKLEITRERVLEEMAKLAFSNTLNYMRVQEDGTAVLDLSGLTRDQAAAITEISTEEIAGGRGEDQVPVLKTRIKVADKKGALEMLAKHLGLFEKTDSGESEGKVFRLVMEARDG